MLEQVTWKLDQRARRNLTSCFRGLQKETGLIEKDESRAQSCIYGPAPRRGGRCSWCGGAWDARKKRNWPGQEDFIGRYLWGVKASVPLCEFASGIKSKDESNAPNLWWGTNVPVWWNHLVPPHGSVYPDWEMRNPLQSWNSGISELGLTWIW